MATYGDRNILLRKLGFKDYCAYLGSELWLSTRSKVIRRDKRKCRCCGDRAVCVHHNAYDRATLKGKRLDQLFSLCDKCHNAVEVDSSGRKRSLVEAQQQFAGMLKNTALQTGKPKPTPSVKGLKIQAAQRARQKAKQSSAELAKCRQWIGLAEAYRKMTKPERRAYLQTLNECDHKIFMLALQSVPRIVRSSSPTRTRSAPIVNAKTYWPPPRQQPSEVGPLARFVEQTRRITA